ncbi:MAG: PAS domain S-box protein [Desulfuromonadales bacterium]|jgi:PAS domain S-box-containing protein
MSQEPTADIYRDILEQAPDAILFADREGRIRIWNQGAERIFGFTAAEALGQSLDLIIPEKLRGRHWEGYRQVMATGESRYAADALLSVPALHRDGHSVSVEFSIVMPTNAAEPPTGVAAILRDVTARWQKEKELKARLAALEK